MSWFKRRKGGRTEDTSWNSVDARDEALAELDRIDADGYLDPDEAVELGQKLRPLYEQERAKGALDQTWDERAYSTMDAVEQRAGDVDGQHYTAHVGELNRLRSSKDDDAALALLLKAITAAERQAKITGTYPAPAYTHRAAVIYRRRKDYESEIDAIVRWQKRCAPGQADGNVTGGKLAARLVKARELLEKSRHQ